MKPNVENTLDQAIANIADSLKMVAETKEWQKSRDTLGDEGEQFANFVQRRSLSFTELQRMQTEDDRATLILDEQAILVEQSEADLTQVREGLQDFFGTLQDAISNQVLGNNLPLLGDGLDNNPATQFFEQLQNSLATLQSTDTTPEGIAIALTQFFQSQGLLQNGVVQAEVAADGNTVTYTVTLSQTPVNSSSAIAQDVGLPNLGLEIEGNTETELGYGFQLKFGINKTDGFFIDTSTANELELNLDVTTPDLDTTATLGFLEFNAKDNGTALTGDFGVDLKDADNRLFRSEFSSIATHLSTVFNGNAEINLNLTGDTSIDFLPSLDANFVLNWNFVNANPQQGQTFGSTPQIAFNDVSLDLQPLIGDVIQPILEKVQPFVEPVGAIQPILEKVTTPLPVIGRSLLQLAELSGELPAEGVETAIEFVNLASEINDFIESFPDEDSKIDLGDFVLTGVDVRSTKLSDVDPSQTVDPANPTPQPINPTTQLATLATNPLDGQLKGFEFPIIDNPTSAIGLLLGSNQPADLVTYTPPELDLSLPLDPIPGLKIPIFGPLVIQFGTTANVNGQLSLGFDTQGLQQFSETGDATQLANGFYLERGTLKEEQTETGVPIITIDEGSGIVFNGEVNAQIAVDLGVVTAAVGGGLGLGVSLVAGRDLPDTPENQKIRGSELDDPLCLLDPEGVLSAVIFASIRLKLTFFSITKRFNLVRTNIMDFSLGCETEDPFDVDVRSQPLDQETRDRLAGQGVIEFTDSGADTTNQITLNSTAGQVDGTLDRRVELTVGGNAPEIFEDVTLAVMNGLVGDDIINMSSLVASGQLEGGEGNDQLTGGGGDDFLAGGAGNDNLEGNGGINTVIYSDVNRNPNQVGVTVNLAENIAINDGFGSVDTLVEFQNIEATNGQDDLTGNGEDNFLDARAGDDIVFGGDGKDVLLGGAGGDRLDGGEGTDFTTYIDSPSSVVVILSNGQAFGGDATGDTLISIENLQGSVFDDFLIGNASDNQLDALSGDDFLEGGTGRDTFDGGTGIDQISYLSSQQGVLINLKTGVGSAGNGIDGNPLGGDGSGDVLTRIQNEAGQNTEFNTIENLDGSNFGDILLGDVGQNTLRGFGGNDLLNGDQGNDTLVGGLGADILDGADGIDLADYFGSTAAVTVNLTTNVASGGEAEGDRFVSLPDNTIPGTTIENLRGSEFADALIGSDLANEINPEFSYKSVSTVDFVDGALGNDTLVVDYSRRDEGEAIAGGITNSTTGTGSISRRTTNVNGVVNAAIDGVNFQNIENLKVIGTTRNDSITGGNGNDQLFMGAGDDTIIGGLGSNRIFGDAGNDTVIDQNLVGETIEDTPRDALIDINGGVGIDTLSIDLSNRLDFSDPNNPKPLSVVLESMNPLQENPNQNFISTDGTVAIRNFEVLKDIQTGRGDDRLVQLDRVNNRFSTAGGNDEINAGLGFDVVGGGSNQNESGGDDLLIVDYSVGDIGTGMLSEFNNFGEGRYFRTNSDNRNLLDEVKFDGIERFNITGTSKQDNIQTRSGNDSLSGGAGNDILSAGFGADELLGGDGNDQLIGTRLTATNLGIFERDTLTGGASADSFLLAEPEGALYDDSFNKDYALITDFDPTQGDVITLFGAGNTFDGRYFLAQPPAGLELGIGIFRDLGGEAGSDLVAIVQGTTDFTLTGQEPFFKFVGDSIPVPA